MAIATIVCRRPSATGRAAFIEAAAKPGPLYSLFAVVTKFRLAFTAAPATRRPDVISKTSPHRIADSAGKKDFVRGMHACTRRDYRPDFYSTVRRYSGSKWPCTCPRAGMKSGAPDRILGTPDEWPGFAQTAKEWPMHYKPKNVAALQIALGSLPGKTRVEVEPDVKLAAKSVAELRRLQSWPENLALSVPPAIYVDSVVKVSSVHFASRTSPKA